MKRPCLGYPGHRCARLVAGASSRCTDCQRAMYALRNQRRPAGERAFYGSAEWRALARAVIDSADRCATCGSPATVTKLTGGHRIPIRERPDLALSIANVIAQCIPCQSRMKARPDPATWQPWERQPRLHRW